MARWMASVAPVAAKAASVSPSGMEEARPETRGNTTLSAVSGTVPSRPRAPARGGIDQARAWRARGREFLGHDGAGIEADRAARDEVAPAHGDEVGGAGPGAPERAEPGRASPLASAHATG